MENHGLKRSNNGSSIYQTQSNQPVQTDNTTESTEETKDKNGSKVFKDLLVKHSAELVSVVVDIIHGKLEIAKMRADTDEHLIDNLTGANTTLKRLA